MSVDEWGLPEYIVEAQLEQYRVTFEAGNADALMHALLFCAKEQLVMPKWMVRELHQAWHRFVGRSVEDLGEAFGIQWPKGSQKAAYRKKRRFQFAVHRRIKELHFKDEWTRTDDGEWQQVRNRPIDGELFAEVGRELGIGMRSTREYYYAVEKMMDSMRETLLSYRAPAEDTDK